MSKETPLSELINVARCVLAHTEITREHNGRGRSKTYASDIDTIANAARHLADLVMAMEPPPPAVCTCPLWTSGIRHLPVGVDPEISSGQWHKKTCSFFAPF